MRWQYVALAVVILGGVGFAQDAVRNSDSVIRFENLLANLIHQTRVDAIERGVQPIPSDFRTEFEQFIDPEILDSVRWRIDGETGILGNILFQSAAVRAVTVEDVIMFANAEEAANIKLWAHELHHVVQFRHWGVDGFAQRFLADHRSIEREALEFRWSWMKATDRVPD